MTTATTGTDISAGYRLDQATTAGSFVRLGPDVGVTSREHANVRVRSIERRAPRAAEVQKKVQRRMQGFVIEAGGEEAKVAFVVDGRTHEYYLPGRPLRDAGITGENQPFQMDEVEVRTQTGVIVGYEFQPLAKPSDAFSDSIALDADRERKRNLIFKTFGHAET